MDDDTEYEDDTEQEDNAEAEVSVVWQDVQPHFVSV